MVLFNFAFYNYNTVDVISTESQRIYNHNDYYFSDLKVNSGSE